LGLDGRARPLDESLGAAAQAELARLRATADRTIHAVDGLLAEDPALTGLASGGVTALHVEAPPHALDALAERGLLDRVLVFVTPTLGATPAPGTAEPGPLAGQGQPDEGATCTSTLHRVTYERLGDTVLVSGYVHGTEPPRQDAGRAD
jgi:riboflavin biosynthesis pyrimidine reductase